MPVRILRHLLLIMVLFAGVLPTVRGEDYPSRPIRLIVTTSAGSLVDVLGRMFAEDLGARLGQNLVVDNRPGGMTQIGVEALNRAPPDGYTLMIGTSEATMLPFLKKSYRYDPLHDLIPIALLTTSWTVFAINPKVPATSLAGLSPMPGAIPAAFAMAPAGSAARSMSRSRCCA
jgi:tripartite-type tricarboxylate transporter receptor subunit TctC